MSITGKETPPLSLLNFIVLEYKWGITILESLKYTSEVAGRHLRNLTNTFGVNSSPTKVAYDSLCANFAKLLCIDKKEVQAFPYASP